MSSPVLWLHFTSVKIVLFFLYTGTNGKELQKGMVLPFQPLSMSFSNINYYVDVPLVDLCTSFSCPFHVKCLHMFHDSYSILLAGTEATGYIRGSATIIG